MFSMRIVQYFAKLCYLYLLYKVTYREWLGDIVLVA